VLYSSYYQQTYGVERKRIVMPSGVKLRLNRGERPDQMPRPLLNTIYANQRLGYVQRYPSYQQFYERLSTFIGFPAEQIVVGAGIEELIRNLMLLAGDRGAAVLWPTCAMYDIYAQAFGVDLLRITTDPNRTLDITEVMHSVRKGVGVLFLPNPGQPVETCYQLGELESLANWCWVNNIVLAVDEAHHGFGAPTALPLVHKFDNVIVMRTFSKFFGAASIRVGFAVGQARVIKPLHAVRASGEIAGPSMQIATTLLDNYAEVWAWAGRTSLARDLTRNMLVECGLKVKGKYGFSLLIEAPSPDEAARVAEELASRGTYVKQSFAPPVERHLLAAVGDPPMMKTFMDQLKEICKC